MASVVFYCGGMSVQDFVQMNYSQLNLTESLFKGLEDAGYTKCTPVQEKVLAVSLSGNDLYVQSQTGSGKTAAFLVTIIEQLLKKSDGKNALILVPTRELAVQVEKEAKKLTKYTQLKTASFFGGVGYEKQVEALKNGVDILIGTPGRLLDLQESKKLNLGKTAFLAIDEADRMFDMGFYPDLRKILGFLPDSSSRQTMLFSATLNSYVKNLAWEYTLDALEISIDSGNITVDQIQQELIHVSSTEKLPLLLSILNSEKPESLIIFCNTKKTCEILSKRLLINGFKNEYIIGDLPQKKRLKIMGDFKSGKIKCLIATDVAARGIDVNELAMVINYDVPDEAENYVHRIGRTARAGKSGKAYTLCSEQDVYSLLPVERYIEMQIPSRVAVKEELAEDKSSGFYIKLDGKPSLKPEKIKKTSDRQKSGLKNADFKRQNLKNRKNQYVSSAELEKLSLMSSDERMKYYKNKYAGQKNINEGAKPAKPQNTTSRQKNVPDKKKGLLSKIKSLFKNK